jgi:hypothetical protein
MSSQMFGAEPPTLSLRDAEWVAGLLSEHEIAAPGVVPVPLWRPEAGDDNDRNPEMYQACAALARKP